MRHVADLPLSAVAAAQAEEVQQLANVHGDDDLALRGVGQQIARVFGGHARLEQRMVGVHRSLDCLVERLGCLGIARDALRLDHRHIARELHITLALLVEAGDAVAHELMRERSRHAVDGERVACMLKGAEMPRGHDGGKHALDALGRHGLHQLGSAYGRIAQARGRGDSALRIRGMVEQLYVHGMLLI